jgi:hypothetical protein
MTRRPHSRTWIVWLAILGIGAGCTRRGQSTGNQAPAGQAPAAASSSAPPSVAAAHLAAGNTRSGTVREPHAPTNAMPTELLNDRTSAYNAGLVVDADAIYVLTDRVVYRVVPGASPQRIPVENGGTAAATTSDIVYWSKGAIWRVPKVGGKAEQLAALTRQPQFFVASDSTFAWLDMPEQDHFALQTLSGSTVRTLLYYAGRIEAVTLDAGRLFFVRKDDGSSWRIGSVSIHGGEANYTSPKSGPTPAKLAAAGGDVFYYQLSSGELRRLSADLSHEEVLRKDLVCSPIAVAAKIYCPRMEGLFELARPTGADATLVFRDPRPITNVAASTRFLAWLADAGPDRLSLMMIPLVSGG